MGWCPLPSSSNGEHERAAEDEDVDEKTSGDRHRNIEDDDEDDIKLGVVSGNCRGDGGSIPFWDIAQSSLDDETLQAKKLRLDI